jgi:hypothetical protein
MQYFSKAIPIVVLMLSLLYGCKKNEPVPHNPYNDIVRDDTTQTEIPLDSLNITYIHKKVLAPTCAVPGCHVGNFEPDFRTPQSSFSTLVYAPVIKNNTQNQFKYRVVPYDTTWSVLHERITNCCFVNNNDRMPQDNIGTPMPDSSIKLIERWIMHGARDMFGNVAQLPNSEPVITGYIAFDTISLIPPFATPSVYYSNNRLDGVYYNPFIVPVNKSVFYIVFKVTDDSTAEAQLQYNKLKISTNADNFASATTYNASFLNLGNGNSGWLLTIPTASLPANDTLYMRYFVNDGKHPQNTEFPRNDLPYAYKTFYSFIRQ